MKKLLLLPALLAGGLLGLQDITAAHGGTYRGPGDTVPPGGGGGGGGGQPGMPGPAGPSGGSPGAPGAPAPATPGAPAGQPAGGPRTPMTAAGDTGPDLTVWQFWWAFNKDPYLNLKAKIHAGGTQTGSDDFFLGRGAREQSRDSLRPSQADIREKVVPALLSALEKERQNDILTGAMIALAKIGDTVDESGESPFVTAISKFLADSNQEVAETAAVALGILAHEASVPNLVSLMNDDAVGQKLVGSTEVPYRTRAFAAYGMGLIGYSTSDNALRQQIAGQLVDILNAPHFATRDIKVAAMTAFGLTKTDLGGDGIPELDEDDKSSAKWTGSREAQIAFLLDYFDSANERPNLTTRHWYVRAHAPVAMARLLDETEAPALKAAVVDMLLRHLGPHSTERDEVKQSCTIALGMLGDADADDVDAKIRAELTRLVKEGDQQSRRFAMIALAQSGGRPGKGENPWAGTDDVRKQLVTQMSRGTTPMRPWAALALGVYGRALIDNGATPDSTMLLALRSAATDEKGPDAAGAYLIALGLQRDRESMDLLLERMEFFSQDEPKGEAAVALGLLEDTRAIQPIQEIIRTSEYRPELLKQAAIALGLLGDKELVEDLIGMLKEANGLATQAALASALGSIGDSRSIDPLVEMLGDQEITATARGFAAVALGIVCDKEPLPWNSKISTNINYRANTLTLTSAAEGTGILDIL